MQDGMYMASERRANGAPRGVSQFASEVVARLVGRDTVGGAVMRESLVASLLEAVRSTDVGAFDAMKPELKRARVSAATLADIYIPEVARRLGQAWQDDVVSFADVTMGVARLQAILREIGTTWVADDASTADVATMLLILPAGEQHTLGALVIAGWLRRKGISVCLRIAPSTSDLQSLLALRKFDGAMISIACEDKLEVCAKLVKTLKEATDNKMRIAVGGAVMERVGDVVAQTGATIVTNDLSAAVVALGFNRTKLASAGAV